MAEHKKKQVFIQGAISPGFIADSIAKHSSKMDIGAHSIFLGQVRKDIMEGKEVTAIEYSAHEDMANDSLHTIREAIFAKYPLTCMHIYHSLGKVAAGEICLFVFTSSAHRPAAIAACSEVVEFIKKEVAIWGKEIFEDGGHQWKINQ
jgi:molybdopterin synthase catalytic subunit